jgi:hypothetical protein
MYHISFQHAQAHRHKLFHLLIFKIFVTKLHFRLLHKMHLILFVPRKLSRQPLWFYKEYKLTFKSPSKFSKVNSEINTQHTV